MQFVFLLVILSCLLFEVKGYPYFSSLGNVDSWPGDADRNGMVLSSFYDPQNSRRAIRSGPTTFSLRQPYTELPHEPSEYQAILRRRQALLEVNDTPPQQNEIYYPREPENIAVTPVETTEFVKPAESTEVIPTTKSVTIPELAEPELEEPVQTSKKAVNKKTQVKRPIDDDEDESNYPNIPMGSFFPMFFGWGGRSGGNGPIAIANSFSTGRAGASTSHAIAVGTPNIENRV